MNNDDYIIGASGEIGQNDNRTWAEKSDRAMAISSLKGFKLNWHIGIKSGALFTQLNSDTQSVMRSLVEKDLDAIGVAYSVTAVHGSVVITISDQPSIERLSGILAEQGAIVDESHEPASNAADLTKASVSQGR